MTMDSDWERCRQYIEPALTGTHSLQDVENQILEQRALFLAGDTSALICEVLTYPQLKVLRIWLGGGDLPDLMTFKDYVIELAKNLGCSRIRIEGRTGWVKALKPIGIDRSWTVIEKDV